MLAPTRTIPINVKFIDIIIILVFKKLLDSIFNCSDLQGMRTNACPDGNDWILNKYNSNF